jgi:hypothetical protein
MIHYGPPERVYVESDWYDGPRAGIADISGQPHRFSSLFDEAQDQYLGTFLVWPVDKDILALEIEQWQIFVDWNVRFESGEAHVESHPGNGGLDPRWDELEMLLERSRATVPIDAKRALAQFEGIDREKRYEPSGPGYMVRWCIL